MGDDLPPYKRQMESPPDKPPPCKQKSCESAFLPSTEQNSSAIEHGLEDTSDSSEKKGESEDCGNDEKDETEINEENHGVNKIQPGKTCSNVEPAPIPPPGPIQFTSVQSDSVSLVWGPPEGWTGCQNFKVTWESGGLLDSRDVTSSKACIRDLSPGEKYEFKVVTLGEDNQQSECVSATTNTEIPAPEELKVKKDEDPVVVTWRKPEGLDQVEYVLSLWKKGRKGDEEECLRTIIATSEEWPLPNLKLNMTYIIKVSIVLKNSYQGKATTCRICRVPAPGQLKEVSVTPTSAKLTWRPPHGMKETPDSYQISYHSGEGTDPKSISTHSCSAEIKNLNPYTNYNVSVSAKLKDGGMSEPAQTKVHTAVPGPGQITVVSVTQRSANLTWPPPQGMDQTPYYYQISYHSGGTKQQTISKESSAVITNLKSCTKYSVSICTKVTDNTMSETVTKDVCTAVPAPEQLAWVSLTPTSANLTWKPPQGMDQTPDSYQISYYIEGTKQQTQQTISTYSCSADITGLRPCTRYTVSIIVKLTGGEMSEAVGKVFHTATQVPKVLPVTSVTVTSAKLKWRPPHGMDHTPYSYQISYNSGGTEPQIISTQSCSADITGLNPCSDYVVSVCTKPKDWEPSDAVEIIVYTAVPAPEQLTGVSETPTSINLTWSPPHGMDQTPRSYQISYHSRWTKLFTISSDSCSADITGLQPDTDYTISVCTKIKEGRMSEPVKKVIHTDILTRKFYTVVIGNSQNRHQALKGMLINKGLREVKHVESCDLILAFCVIVSRVGTDMEAALKEIPDSKPAVLAVMHHTFDPEHVTPDTSRFVRGRKIMVVDILFHEDKGILRCQKNTEAENKMLEMVWACSESDRPKYPLPTPKAKQPRHTNTDAPNNSTSNSVPSHHGNNSGKSHGYKSESKENATKAICSSASSTELNYSAVVSGNTLGADKDVKKRLTDRGVLPKEVSSAAQCNFLLVFCPIVSSVGSDIDKALQHIPDGKPSILVVMHHTFNADYLPPDTRRYAKGSNMIIVDCLFYEDTGLLKCHRNDEALDHVSKWLQGKFPNLGKGGQNMLNPSIGESFLSHIPGISRWRSNKKE